MEFIMALHMRDQLIRAVSAHATGEIEKHKANVEVYLEHPAGIGEHSDVAEEVLEKLKIIAEASDVLDTIDVIQKDYFSKDTKG